MKTGKSLPEEIGALTGLTMLDLANLVQVFPSDMSRFADHKRSIPTAAMLDMANMLIVLNALPENAPPPLTEEEREDLKKMAEDCRFKCLRLQKRLDKAISRYGQGQKLLQLLAHMASLPENNVKLRKLWIEIQQLKAEKRMSENGPLVQTKLAVAIDLLQREEEAY